MGVADELRGAAALPPGVSSGWWGQVQQDIAASEYHVSWQERTGLPDVPMAYQAPNRAHNLRTYFTQQGVRVVPRIDPASPEDHVKQDNGRRLSSDTEPARRTGTVPSSHADCAATARLQATTSPSHPERGKDAASTWRGTPSWELGLELVGYSMGGKAMSVPRAKELLAESDKIEYHRDGLTEWYINGTGGLEQGFTIEKMGTVPSGSSLREPTGQSPFSLSLDIAVTGNLIPNLTPDGQAVEFLNAEGVGDLAVRGSSRRGRPRHTAACYDGSAHWEWHGRLARGTTWARCPCHDPAHCGRHRRRLSHYN